VRLIETSVFSALTTGVRLISSLVINKAVSVYLGPSGLGIIGQFQNIFQIAQTISQGAFNAGVTKYASEYRDSQFDLKALVSTALTATLICSLSVALVAIVFSLPLATHFFHSPEHRAVFILLGVVIAFVAVNNLILSVLNGLGEFRLFFQLSILGAVYSLVFSTGLILYYGLNGALIAVASNQAVMCFVSLYFVLRRLNFSSYVSMTVFSNDQLSNLLKYSSLAITSAVLYQGYFMYTRNLLLENYNWSVVGIWQGMQSLSAAFSGLFFGILSTYYLPRLSELNNQVPIMKELKNGLLLFIPALLSIVFFVYIFREDIVLLLFTRRFLSMEALFLPQLAGDFLKISAFLFSTILTAKAKIRIAITSEVFFYGILFLLTAVLVPKFGPVGAAYAYFLHYLLFLVFAVFIFFHIKNELPR
jgi:O-antigen/teichoic acid export membrane protein